MSKPIFDSHPSVEISIKHNRVRKYGTVIYMKNGTEFELEFGNNTHYKWLSKIKINDEWISDKGLILRPGEHTYLERFLDESRKFIFDTYFIPVSREPVTEKNGLIDVYFYREYFIQHPWQIVYMPIPDTTSWSEIPTTPRSYYTSNIINNYFHENDIETGCIKTGGESGQTLVGTSDSFVSYHEYHQSFKILPISRKSFIDKKDIRLYCNCGRRQRRGDNYCPKCGAKY